MSLTDSLEGAIHISDPFTDGTLKVDPETRDALAHYKRAIENLADSNSDFIFPNSTGFHAAIVLTAMVEHSTRVFRLYDESLNGDLSGEFDINRGLIGAFRSHVVEGRTLEIVVRENTTQKSKIYRILSELYRDFKDRVSVRIASDDFKSAVTKVFEKDLSFAVGDEESFRLEEKTEDPFERKAICSFSRPEYAKRLNRIFDKEFAGCLPIF